MPWGAAATNGLPTNATPGAPYRGGNVVMLGCAALDAGYESNKWATFKQWQAAGANVRKGEHGTRAFYFDRITRDREMENVETGETETVTATIPFLKSFVVFNAAQVDGWADDA